jgi:hypothetical protein
MIAKLPREAPVVAPHDMGPTAARPTAVMRKAIGSAMPRRTMMRDTGLDLIQPPAAEPAIDASLYMFALCNYLQTAYLAPRGVRYVLDADSIGKLPGPVCRMLGLMVCDLVHDASACARPETETVTVTLRRRGTTFLCTISRRCADKCACSQTGLQRALRLGTELGDACIIRSIPERGLTAFMFDIHLVEPCIPAALSRYRSGEASRRAERSAAMPV